jgi:transcriptional regulator with XRE-family HTH domain
MTFREKHRDLRAAAGLSEAKLAELSGVSLGAVHNYGLSLRQPTFAAVVRIAGALRVTCEAFSECEDIADAPLRSPTGTPKRNVVGQAASEALPGKKKGKK